MAVRDRLRPLNQEISRLETFLAFTDERFLPWLRPREKWKEEEEFPHLTYAKKRLAVPRIVAAAGTKKEEEAKTGQALLL